MRYVLEVKPKVCFPVHDGMGATSQSANFVPKKVLPERGIEFRVLEIGKEEEF